MCRSDRITPTKDGVYLRRTTKSKATTDRSVTRASVGGSSSSRNCKKCSGDNDGHFVFRCGSSSSEQKKGKKQVKQASGSDSDEETHETMWRFRCEAKGEKGGKGRKNGMVKVAAKIADCCHCNGGDNDGWLCDICRSVEKKKGFWKFVTSGSGSDSSCDCCDSSSGCDCSQHDSSFAEECDSWMKAAAKKRKAALKAQRGCDCYRQGCKYCLIINC